MNELKGVKTVSKNKKRVGRGGKRGTYSGRGQKGQKARAGRKRPNPALEVVFKMPKLRGEGNRKKTVKTAIINIADLGKINPDGLITIDAIMKAGLIKRKSDPVKILNKGDLQKSFNIEGISVSKSTREKIIKAGGSVK